MENNVMRRDPVSPDSKGCPLSFEEDLWDNLQAVSDHCKRGGAHLFGLSHFCRSYIKVLSAFSQGLSKCTEQFEKDMLKDKGFDTTTIAVTGVRAGLGNMITQVNEKITKIQSDIVDPLDQFHKQYISSTHDLFNNARLAYSIMDDEKKKVIQIRDKYYKLMSEGQMGDKAIERSLVQLEREELTLDQVKRLTNMNLNIKYRAENECQEYRRVTGQFNSVLDRFQDDYKPMLSRLQQGEESRINFLKYNLEKLMKYFSLFGKNIIETSSEMQSQVSQINSETDIRIFIDEYRTGRNFQPKIEFQQYDPSWNKQEPEEIDLPQVTEQDAENLMMNLKNLICGQDISFDQKSEMISAMHDKDIRNNIAVFLREITGPRYIEDLNALKTLGELFKYLLTAFVHEKDEDYRVIVALLQTSHLIFSYGDDSNQRVFLTNLLADHGLWQESTLWSKMIFKLINQKFHEAVTQPGIFGKQHTSLQSQEGVIGSGVQAMQTGLMTGLGKLKGALWFGSNKSSGAINQQEGEQKMSYGQQDNKISKPLAQNIVFNILSKFLPYFINFQLGFEQSRDIVLDFCQKYELDQTRTHLLLSELESSQKKGVKMISDKEKIEISLQKRSKRQQEFGDYLILGMVLKFIDSDQLLVTILTCNKTVYEKLKMKVYKQALLRSQPYRLVIKRPQIWSNILKIGKSERDYNAFKQKVIANSDIIKNVEEVINMDVQRSFTSMEGIDPAVLTFILKTYAFFNPEIEYCQGMNFVAGFLLLYFKDEESSFTALNEIIDRFDMAQLFNQELPKLRIFFYQFDRMVSIQAPQLHNHFKDELINSSYYSSAWFITLFTNALQMQTQGQISENLLQLWDYMLTSGWVAIFRMGLYILKENEKEILEMNFEQILNFISEKSKLILAHIEPLIKENEESQEETEVLYKVLKKSAQSFEGTQHFLLKKLEQEFMDQYETASNASSQGRKAAVRKQEVIKELGAPAEGIKGKLAQPFKQQEPRKAAEETELKVSEDGFPELE